MIEPSDILKDLETAAEPEKDFLAIALSKKVSQTDKVPRPETVLELTHSSPRYRLFHKQSISTLSGKAKVGKTTVMALLIAGILKSGLRICWIDTEQGAFYASSTQFYLLQVAGINYCENLHMFDFREFGPVDRIALTEAILNSFEFDLVIVDGVRDYIFDINNPTEATNITTRLMKWSVDYNCHVSMLIHENKQGGELRGHLGSECENKSEIVLSLSQSADTVPIIIIKCKAVRGRAKFDDFFVRRDENGLPYVDTNISNTSSISIINDEKPRRIKDWQPRDYPVNFHINFLHAIFAHFPDGLGAVNFKKNMIKSWNIIYDDHFDTIEHYYTRSEITEDFARKLKDYYENVFTTENLGKGTTKVITIHPEYLDNDLMVALVDKCNHLFQPTTNM